MNAESSRPAFCAPTLGKRASASDVTSAGPSIPASARAPASFLPSPGQSPAAQNAAKTGSDELS
jgi:hypothetical protein